MDIDIIEQKFRQYFKPYELVSYAHYQHLNGDADAIYKLFTHRIKAIMVYLREAFNTQVIINNWHNYLEQLKYRSIAELEKELGIDIYEFRGYRWNDCKIGASKSQHKLGNAIDATFKGFTADSVRLLIRDRFMKDLPYPARLEDKVKWVHIDSNNLTKYKLQFFTV